MIMNIKSRNGETSNIKRANAGTRKRVKGTPDTTKIERIMINDS